MADYSAPNDQLILTRYREDDLQHQLDDFIGRYVEESILDDINNCFAKFAIKCKEEQMLRVMQSVVNNLTGPLDSGRLYQLFDQYFNLLIDETVLVENKNKLIELFGPLLSVSKECISYSSAQHRNVCLLLCWIWLEPFPGEQNIEPVLTYLSKILNHRSEDNEGIMYAVLSIQRIVIEAKLSNQPLKDRVKGEITSSLEHYAALLESVDSPWASLNGVTYQLAFSSCWLLNQLDPLTGTAHLCNSPHLLVIDDSNKDDPSVRTRRVPCLISPLLLMHNPSFSLHN